DADGTIDATSHTRATYDLNGHLLTYVNEDDDNGDGALSRRETGTLTYGATGLLLTTASEADQAETIGGTIDGIIDSRTSSTREYDADGNVVREVATAGQTGFTPVTSISVRAYDSRGNVVSEQDTLEANGTILTRVDVINTYNSSGQLLTSVTKTDGNGDGTVDQTTVVSVVYVGVKR
ncbi:MAG: hypothetical protein ABIX28_14235, partial [Vicinamibacterales bacterium]